MKFYILFSDMAIVFRISLMTCFYTVVFLRFSCDVTGNVIKNCTHEVGKVVTLLALHDAAGVGKARDVLDITVQQRRVRLQQEDKCSL